VAGECPHYPEPSAKCTDEGDALRWVTAFLARRRHLLVRLERVNAALARWWAGDPEPAGGGAAPAQAHQR
jgi:hypothetical protein